MNYIENYKNNAFSSNFNDQNAKSYVSKLFLEEIVRFDRKKMRNINAFFFVLKIHKEKILPLLAEWTSPSGEY